jgi:hypothetical protein
LIVASARRPHFRARIQVAAGVGAPPQGGGRGHGEGAANPKTMKVGKVTRKQVT